MKNKWFIFVLIVVLTAFAFTGCTPPANGNEGEGEGEGEGEPQTKKVVLVEAFVADGCAICKKVEPHLEKLAKEYGRDEMILVEIVPWLTYTTKNGGDRYKWYGMSGGTPQIIFNGLTYKPLTGNTSYSAIKSKIDAQLRSTPKISIQASRTEEGGVTIISGTITNIGDTDLSNMVINCMTFRDNGVFPYHVNKIYDDKKESVDFLAAGNTKSFSLNLGDVNWKGLQLDGVIFVQDTTSNKLIRQSLFID